MQREVVATLTKLVVYLEEERVIKESYSMDVVALWEVAVELDMPSYFLSGDGIPSIIHLANRATTLEWRQLCSLGSCNPTPWREMTSYAQRLDPAILAGASWKQGMVGSHHTPWGPLGTLEFQDPVVVTPEVPIDGIQFHGFGETAQMTKGLSVGDEHQFQLGGIQAPEQRI